MQTGSDSSCLLVFNLKKNNLSDVSENINKIMQITAFKAILARRINIRVRRL